MKTTCCILLLSFCAAVSGRELLESAEGLPDKCAGPFVASNVTFYRAEGIGSGRSCDTFRAEELPVDEALGLVVRLTAPPANNVSQFNLQKQSTEAALAPSKACLLENWEAIGGKPTFFQFRPCIPTCCKDPPNGRRRRQLMMMTTTHGEDAPGPAADGLETGRFRPAIFRRFRRRPCTPAGCTDPPNGRRRRRLMMMTTQGEDLEVGEDAPGLASDGLETGEVGEGEAAIITCNGRCCVLLIVKDATLKAVAN